MDERVPMIMSHFYQIEPDCVRVSQPTTEVEVVLTGDARRVWEFIERHRGASVSQVADAFETLDERLDAQAVASIIEYLHALRLLVLEESGGW